MRFENPAAFAKFAIGVAAASEVGWQVQMEEIGEMVEKEAKSMIGHLQRDLGPFRDWEPLHDATIEDKKADFQGPEYAPLFRTGVMQASITHSAAPYEARIGSDDKVALWQELGTPGVKHPIPPRSFLGGAAIRKEKEIVAVIWGEVELSLSGRRRLMASVSLPGGWD